MPPARAHGALAESRADKTRTMEADVLQMEARLQQLKSAMSVERERRDASRQRNPTGSVWRSARSDAPVSSGAYVQQVLKVRPTSGAKKGVGGLPQRQPASSLGGGTLRAPSSLSSRTRAEVSFHARN